MVFFFAVFCHTSTRGAEAASTDRARRVFSLSVDRELLLHSRHFIHPCRSCAARLSTLRQATKGVSLRSKVAHRAGRGVHNIPFQRDAGGRDHLHRIAGRRRCHISIAVGCIWPIGAWRPYRRFSPVGLVSGAICRHIAPRGASSCKSRGLNRPRWISFRVACWLGGKPPWRRPVRPAWPRGNICCQQWCGYNKAECTAANYRFHLICLLQISDNPRGLSGSIPSMKGIRGSRWVTWYTSPIQLPTTASAVSCQVLSSR